MPRDTEVITSYDALYSYASDLYDFVESLETERDNMKKAILQVGFDWRDNGFQKFSDSVDVALKKLNVQLEKLADIADNVVDAADVIYEAEQKQKQF